MPLSPKRLTRAARTLAGLKVLAAGVLGTE